MLPCWLTGCSKKLLAAWKAARKRGKMKKKMNVGGEPKETAVSREIMPADGGSPAQRGVRHVPAYDRHQLISRRQARQIVIPTPHSILRARRSARLPPAARPRAAIGRGHIRAARLDIDSPIGTHVRNGSEADIRRA